MASKTLEEKKIDKEIEQEVLQEVLNLLPGDETTISLLKQEIKSGEYDEEEKKELNFILEKLEAQKELYPNSPAKMKRILDKARNYLSSCKVCSNKSYKT